MLIPWGRLSVGGGASCANDLSTKSSAICSSLRRGNMTRMRKICRQRIRTIVAFSTPYLQVVHSEEYQNNNVRRVSQSAHSAKMRNGMGCAKRETHCRGSARTPPPPPHHHRYYDIVLHTGDKVSRVSADAVMPCFDIGEVVEARFNGLDLWFSAAVVRRVPDTGGGTGSHRDADVRSLLLWRCGDWLI